LLHWLVLFGVGPQEVLFCLKVLKSFEKLVSRKGYFLTDQKLV